jgi:hypothetical protein
LNKYDADLAQRKPQYQTRVVSLDQFLEAGEACAKRVRESNVSWSLRLLELVKFVPPLYVELTDLNKLICYRPGHSVAVTNGQKAHISCTADAFLTCLREDYGSATLLISGRFQEVRPGGATMLSRAFAVNRLNARGIRFPFGLWRDVAYLRRRLVRQLRQAIA